jgi:hypothetical protein
MSPPPRSTTSAGGGRAKAPRTTCRCEGSGPRPREEG